MFPSQLWCAFLQVQLGTHPSSLLAKDGRVWSSVMYGYILQYITREEAARNESGSLLLAPALSKTPQSCGDMRIQLGKNLTSVEC